MDHGYWDVTAVGDFDPKDWFGFIYLIEDLDTGKMYLGKKFFLHKRKKTKSNRSRTKESDWKTYTSSCEPLNDLIKEKGRMSFAFRIIRLCSGRCELSYAEQEAQFGFDVLRARLPNGEHRYFNRTISHFNFAGLEKQTAESRRKMFLTSASI